jgi:hypothetical protein
MDCMVALGLWRRLWVMESVPLELVKDLLARLATMFEQGSERAQLIGYGHASTDEQNIASQH